jgi:aminoglycoside phosphotransferase (APT) family kinase protein
MEHIDGAVIGERLPPALDAPAAHAAIARELVDGLAELHAVDPSSADLAGFGRPQGYLERQLRRFSSLWESQRTREVPDLDRITRWLHDHVPATRATTVVHGDYRLGNVMFDTAKPQLLSILDWEMSTLGDPLADLGYLCVTWAQPGDEENPITVLSAVTRGGGFPSPAELREHYATRTGRDVSDLRFYEVLALWKAVVFFESSFRRFREGTTDDPYFARLEAGVPQLAREAIRRTGATSA